MLVFGLAWGGHLLQAESLHAKMMEHIINNTVKLLTFKSHFHGISQDSDEMKDPGMTTSHLSLVPSLPQERDLIFTPIVNTDF